MSAQRRAVQLSLAESERAAFLRLSSGLGSLAFGLSGLSKAVDELGRDLISIPPEPPAELTPAEALQHLDLLAKAEALPTSERDRVVKVAADLRAILKAGDLSTGDLGASGGALAPAQGGRKKKVAPAEVVLGKQDQEEIDLVAVLGDSFRKGITGVRAKKQPKEGERGGEPGKLYPQDSVQNFPFTGEATPFGAVDVAMRAKGEDGSGTSLGLALAMPRGEKATGSPAPKKKPDGKHLFEDGADEGSTGTGSGGATGTGVGMSVQPPGLGKRGVDPHALHLALTEDMDPRELAAGIETESEENGTSPDRARQAAIAHLREHPRYYSALAECLAAGHDKASARKVVAGQVDGEARPSPAEKAELRELVRALRRKNLHLRATYAPDTLTPEEAAEFEKRSRSEMPQIPADRLDEFAKWMRDEKDIAVEPESVGVSQLKSSQDDLNKAKVERLKEQGLEKLLAGPALLVIDGGGEFPILDGHHRAAAIKELDPKATVRVLQIQTSLEAAIAAAHDFPGAEIRGIRDGAVKFSAKIVKRAADDDSEEEQRTVLGIVLEPETIDSQKDIYSADEIRETAWRFAERYQHFGLMHRQLVPGISLLETYLAPVDFEVVDRSGQKRKVKKGTWLLRVRVNDDAIWQAVKSGRLDGFSIGGSAVRRVVKKPARS
jgi:hypothetical protein